MEKLVIIVNKTAGRGKCAHLWPFISDLLGELGVNFDAHFTQAKGDATSLAAEAVRSGATRIVSIGGDGTLHEVVNGIGIRPDVALGIIPAGSGNDFVRSLGLAPGDWQSACRLIADGCTAPIDLGQVNGRYYANVSGVGFDAAVANCANEWGKLHFRGTLAYVAALLRTLKEFAPTDVTIELDDRTVQGSSWLVAVANAQFFGGGMWIAPEASMQDGMFDICILGELSKAGFLRAFPSVFSGKHLQHPAIHLFRSKRVRITTSAKYLVQADGEIVGSTPMDYELHPSALQVYCNPNNRPPKSKQ